jgi:hypothetical protein
VPAVIGAGRVQREDCSRIERGRPVHHIRLRPRETASRISYRDRHGTSKFISKRWAVHTEPCPLCPDCPKAKYPD